MRACRARAKDRPNLAAGGAVLSPVKVLACVGLRGYAMMEVPLEPGEPVLWLRN